MFITLTDLNLNVQVRINTKYITSYRTLKSAHGLPDCTAVYVQGNDNGVYLVVQSPEQIDAILGQCYITIKAEP